MPAPIRRMVVAEDHLVAGLVKELLILHKGGEVRGDALYDTIRRVFKNYVGW